MNGRIVVSNSPLSCRQWLRADPEIGAVVRGSASKCRGAWPDLGSRGSPWGALGRSSGEYHAYRARQHDVPAGPWRWTLRLIRRCNVKDRSMYITDLRHFLDASGEIAPVKGPAKAMAVRCRCGGSRLECDRAATRGTQMLQVSQGRRESGACPRRCNRLGLPALRYRRLHLELVGVALGSARPAGAASLIRGESIGRAERSILLSSDYRHHWQGLLASDRAS